MTIVEVLNNALLAFTGVFFGGIIFGVMIGRATCGYEWVKKEPTC